MRATRVGGGFGKPPPC